jgi:4-oxalocrotonate tautomerase
VKEAKMPYVNIYLLDGRSEDQKREMASRITDAISEVGKVQKEMVHILFIDMPRTNISKGGVLVSDKK